MQLHSNIKLHGSDGLPEDIPGTTTSWGAWAAYIVTVCHTIHCGVWLYVIGPVGGVALIASTRAISIAAKHCQLKVSR